MISLKVLSTVAAFALVLPMMAPTESFAQHGMHRGGGGHPGGGHGGGAHFGGGGFHGGYHRGGGGGALIGAGIAGAVIGGAIASQGYGPGYYGPGPGYYDDQYDDGGPVAEVAAPGGDDSVAYCMQTYKSYDPQSGTYLGYDGYRHPCP
jgi:hypothetical protein